MTIQEYSKVYLSPKAFIFSALKMYLNFLWYFIPIGVIPFIFAGLEWNKNSLSAVETVITILTLSFIFFLPCFFVCYLIHFRRSKQRDIPNLSAKEAGFEVANIFP
jgi:hypothetical protein